MDVDKKEHEDKEEFDKRMKDLSKNLKGFEEDMKKFTGEMEKTVAKEHELEEESGYDDCLTCYSRTLLRQTIIVESTLIQGLMDTSVSIEVAMLVLDIIKPSLLIRDLVITEEARHYVEKKGRKVT